MVAVFKELRLLLALALPIILGQLGQMLMPLTDTAMVGRVSSISLAAASFGGQIVHLFILFGFGLCLPVQVLVARAVGSKERGFEASEFLRHGLVLTFFWGVFCGILVTGNLWVLEHMDQPSAVVAEAKPFVLWLGWSLVPMLLYQCFKNFCEARGRPWLPFGVLLLGIVLNVFFNWVLIFGNLGAPAYGLEGAGIATFISRVCMVCVLAFVVMRDETAGILWRWGTLLKLEGKRVRSMLAIGVPGAFQILFEAGAFIMSVIMMGWLGVSPQAANQVALNYAAFVFMVPLGLSFAISIRVSQAHGMGDVHGVRRAAFTGMACAMVFMAVLSTLTIIFRREIVGIFIRAEDVEVLALASSYLVISGFFGVFDGLQVTALGALRGLSDVKVPAFLIFFSFWVVALPLGAYLGFSKGMAGLGIWWGLLTGLVLVAIVLPLRFLRISKMTKT